MMNVWNYQCSYLNRKYEIIRMIGNLWTRIISQERIWGDEDRNKYNQCENLSIVEIDSSQRSVRNSKRTRRDMECGATTASEARFKKDVISIMHA